MITYIETKSGNGIEQRLNGVRTMQQLNHILQLIAAAYEDDPGVSDLDDDQPAYSVTELTLGDVRLARRLVR